MKSYRDLDIYKESKRLAIEVHALSLTLPRFELYEEGSQVRRSSKAVPAMIVEGYGRKRYKKDFIKYLVYAQAECDETILHLDFVIETGSLTDHAKGNELRGAYVALTKQINKFTQWVDESFKTGQKSRSSLTPQPATSNQQPETDDLDKYLI